jgi:membrane fusion protein (multidrug efflux system)
MQTIKLLSIAAVSGIAIALSGCGEGVASVPAAAKTDTTAPVPVEVMPANRGDIYATYEVAATIASDTDAPVPARVGGDVVEILVEEGDTVAKGDVLARLDGERLRLEMLAAKADLDRVRGEYERLKGLHARNLVSEAMFDGLRYDVEALEATYRLAKLNYGYAAIRAPIGGVVAAREIKPGENLTAGDVTFRITDTAELVAHLKIPQAELSKFTAGDTATFSVDSMPEAEFAATIARISPTIDTRNGTFRATALIDNSGGDLAPGMFARFTIALEKHEDVVIIPAEAVVVEDTETSVYVLAAGEVNKRIIETGVRADGRVEVLSGLDGSEEVVVVGQSSLREGSKVLASSVARKSYIG